MPRAMPSAASTSLGVWLWSSGLRSMSACPGLSRSTRRYPPVPGRRPEGAAQEQPNVERWVIRARPPEETLGSHLDDEDRRDVYTCGIARAGVGCPRLHLGLGNVRPPRGRCLGLCPRRLRHRLKCGRGTLGSGAVLWFGVRCRLAQGCRGQLDDSPQSLGVGPEGAAQEQPNVERWVIRARPPEATLCSRLGDEDRRDVYKLQPPAACCRGDINTGISARSAVLRR